MAEKKKIDPLEAGVQSYERWKKRLEEHPDFKAVYEEEAAKSELWLQLVEARKLAGLTQEQMSKRLNVSQAQVSRIEKRGYDAYTLNTLRKYVEALGEGFALEVRIRTPHENHTPVP